MASRERWKRHEMQIARAFNTERNPCIGGEHSDFDTEDFAGEVKTRKSLPQWLAKGIKQAATQGLAKGKIPVLVLSVSTQGRKTRNYALLELNDMLNVTQEEDDDRPQGNAEVDEDAGSDDSADQARSQ